MPLRRQKLASAMRLPPYRYVRRASNPPQQHLHALPHRPDDASADAAAVAPASASDSGAQAQQSAEPNAATDAAPSAAEAAPADDPAAVAADLVLNAVVAVPPASQLLPPLPPPEETRLLDVAADFPADDVLWALRCQALCRGHPHILQLRVCSYITCMAACIACIMSRSMRRASTCCLRSLLPSFNLDTRSPKCPRHITGSGVPAAAAGSGGRPQRQQRAGPHRQHCLQGVAHAVLSGLRKRCAQCSFGVGHPPEGFRTQGSRFQRRSYILSLTLFDGNLHSGAEWQASED